MKGALIGRDHEIAVLTDALAAASRGERVVLMVTGEAGIGKTRLLEELVTQTLDAGGVASWGRTWEFGQTPPFYPWMGLLGALEIPGDPAPALGSLAEHGDRAARLERFSEVVRFVTRRAAHAPVALLFDDLHASDLSSLELLDYALPLLSGQKVLFALAARDSDATRGVSAVLGRLQRGALRIPLARLDASEVQALVGERADARRVYELSDGNPLFVEELIAAQETRGALGLPPVSSVRSLLRERVARLPEQTRRTLLAAAVIGRDFRARMAADMVGEESARASLEPAAELGLVFSIAPDCYRFSHALVAEALADELDGAARAALHLAAAQALERLAPDDTGAIAHHLLSAGELASTAAVRAAQRAAESCMRKLAFEDAASFFERALACLALGSPGDKMRRALLLCARAEALQHATRHALAAELCDEAAEIARALPEAPSADGAELFARIALVRGLEFRFGHTDPLLVAVLTEALGRLRETGPLPLRAKLLARLAAAEQPSSNPTAAVKKALSAIELAQELDSHDRLEVMYVATAALVDYVEPDALDPILEETLRLARGVNRWISVHTRIRHCFTALVRLDLPEFHVRAGAFRAEADRLGLPRWQRHAPMLDALMALLDGRFEDDLRATAEFETISAQIGDTSAEFLADVHRSLVAWTRTTPLAREVRQRLEQYVPGKLAIAAWFACQDGSREDARAALDQLAERLPEDPELYTMVAATIAFVGDRALAEQAYCTLLPKAGRVDLTAFVGFAVMDLYDRLLLVLATVIERWDAVEDHAESALRVARKLGSPVWRARVEADYADALDRRGRAGDLERARALRLEAQRGAVRFGMTGLAARLGDPAPCAASVEPQASPRAGGTGELRCTRRGSLWMLSGFGESVHVKDSRGMQMIARLVSEPSSPLHALDLAGASEAVDGGDAGSLLDARARQAYRTRLADLISERDAAEELGDRGRIERANLEIDALSAELERAFGLGGRERRAGAASERARTNVQRRIAHALEQIRAASPRIGEHLAASIRTGAYCTYERKGASA